MQHPLQTPPIWRKERFNRKLLKSQYKRHINTVVFCTSNQMSSRLDLYWSQAPWLVLLVPTQPVLPCSLVSNLAPFHYTSVLFSCFDSALSDNVPVMWVYLWSFIYAPRLFFLALSIYHICSWSCPVLLLLLQLVTILETATWECSYSKVHNSLQVLRWETRGFFIVCTLV